MCTGIGIAREVVLLVLPDQEVEIRARGNHNVSSSSSSNHQCHSQLVQLDGLLNPSIIIIEAEVDMAEAVVSLVTVVMVVVLSSFRELRPHPMYNDGTSQPFQVSVKSSTQTSSQKKICHFCSKEKKMFCQI